MGWSSARNFGASSAGRSLTKTRMAEVRVITPQKPSMNQAQINEILYEMCELHPAWLKSTLCIPILVKANWKHIKMNKTGWKRLGEPFLTHVESPFILETSIFVNVGSFFFYFWKIGIVQSRCFNINSNQSPSYNMLEKQNNRLISSFIVSL